MRELNARTSFSKKISVFAILSWRFSVVPFGIETIGRSIRCIRCLHPYVLDIRYHSADRSLFDLVGHQASHHLLCRSGGIQQLTSLLLARLLSLILTYNTPTSWTLTGLVNANALT